MSDSTPNGRDASLQPTTASYPFNKTNADIILRTSDHVDFHVYSQILIAASPFFEGMFEVPQPPADYKALDPLLRICYFINKTKQRSLEEIEPALRAAIKFEMELPTTVLTEELRTLASEHPLEVWAIACRLRLEPVAECAAGHVSRKAPINFAVLKDMDGITAADYFRLREHHRLRRKVPKGFKFLSPASSPPSQLSSAPSSTIADQSLAHAPPPDLVCRSVEGLQFRAHKTVLSVASAALREKVASASEPSHPPEEDSSGESALPLVQFQEGGVVLQAILELCYHSPSDVTLPNDLADLTAVAVTAEKYCLKAALPAVWSFWQAIASADPLRAYCYAIRAGHTVGAKEAARSVLNQVVDGVYVEELECTPALAYHRLLDYYERCRGVAKAELSKISNLLGAPPPPPNSEPSLVPATPVVKKPKGVAVKREAVSDPAPDGPRFVHYVHGLSSRLQSRPGSATPTLAELFTEATRVDAWCEECWTVANDILEINKALQQLLNGLSEVELEI